MGTNDNSPKDIITLEETLSFSRKEVNSRHRRYVNPGLVSLLSMIGFDKQFVNAQGMTVVDDAGEEYLDFLGGFGALNHGHNHPEVI